MSANRLSGGFNGQGVTGGLAGGVAEGSYDDDEAVKGLGVRDDEFSVVGFVQNYSIDLSGAVQLDDLDSEILGNAVAGEDEAIGLPRSRDRLSASGYPQVAEADAGAVDGVVGDVLEPEPYFLPDVGRQVDGLVRPVQVAGIARAEDYAEVTRRIG